jgi:hypothetical protein
MATSILIGAHILVAKSVGRFSKKLNANRKRRQAMGIKIYGASDDLIEIEGDIQEEFNVYLRDEHDSRILAVSDGTLLRINYDADGIWRLTRLISGSAEFVKVEGAVDIDTPDVVTLSRVPIRWVVLGKYHALSSAEAD